jgi:GNAT superfamily N-acetyltransferase
MNQLGEMKMNIRAYQKAQDEDKLMHLIEEEGWECYTEGNNSEKYRKALEKSITYVAYEGDVLCGYSRSLDDCGFYIYVCDLLVMKEHRGKNIGRQLMECIYADYPEYVVYVMSDVDPYYKKQGYRREGSIFEVTKGRNP